MTKKQKFFGGGFLFVLLLLIIGATLPPFYSGIFKSSGTFTNVSGSILMASSQAASQPGILFMNPTDPLNLSAVRGFFYNDYAHGGAGHDEFIWTALGSISINAGYNASGVEHVQLGSSNPYHDQFYLQYDIHPDAGTPLGYSKPLGFTTVWNGGTGGAYPTLQGMAYDTTGNYAIELYSGPADGSLPSFSASAWQKGSLWYQFGNHFNVNVNQNFVGMAAQSTNNAVVALDFDSKQAVDMQLLASSVTLKTINLRPGTTNFSPRTFVLRSGGLASIAINYPTGWNTNGIALPATITTANALLLDLFALGGVGETNVYVRSAQVLSDNAFAFESEVATYFAALTTAGATLTDSTTKAAINKLVKDLKDNNLWTAVDVIYPFPYQASWSAVQLSNACSIELKTSSTTFKIAWAGANITFNSAGFHGSTTVANGGVTGYKPLSHATSYLQDSSHVLVYVGATLTDNTHVVSTYGTSPAGGRRAGMFRNGTFYQSVGMNNGDANGALVSAAGDFRGPIIATRTTSQTTGNFISVRGGTLTSGGTSVSAGIPDNGFGVGCRWDGSTRDGNSDVVISGIQIGGGLTQGNVTTMNTIWNTYENTMGRQVP